MGQNDELFTVKTLGQALELLKSYVLPFYDQVEEVPLLEALGRIIAKDIPATGSLPHFTKSTVDGLAVQARDTFGASESMPALIQNKGEVRMGQVPTDSIEMGEGYLIPTGGMLPPGSNAVVMIEHIEDFGDGLYGVTKPVAPGENLIEIGEDLQTGEVILERYTRIRAQEIGLLASQGIMLVPVIPRWRVGILSTGDEIVPPEVEPKAAQSRDINGYTLFGQTVETGNIARYYGIVPDNSDKMRQSLELMLKENDLVLLSGGSSVGTRDLSAQLIAELGKPGILFHGLAIRPGKPTIGGVIEGKVILGLPGHPASAMVVFETIVQPLLDASIINRKKIPLPEGILTQNIHSGSGREEFVRVCLREGQEDWHLEPIRGKSGLIRTMVLADGVIHIPLETEGVQAGQRLRVRLLRN